MNIMNQRFNNNGWKPWYNRPTTEYEWKIKQWWANGSIYQRKNQVNKKE